MMREMSPVSIFIYFKNNMFICVFLCARTKHTWDFLFVIQIPDYSWEGDEYDPNYWTDVLTRKLHILLHLTYINVK